MLTAQPERQEFTLSRAGLEVLVVDSERYATANKEQNEVLLAAREVAASTTMVTSDSDALLDGRCDHWLPHMLRDMAVGKLRAVGSEQSA